MKYHINPVTGAIGACTAQPGRCLYSTNGEDPEHYGSKEEAKDAYSKMLEKEYSSISSLKKNVDPHSQVQYRVIEETESATIPTETLDTSHGDEHVVKYYRDVYDHFEGTPRVASRTRVIYFFDDHVIKVPLTDEGEYANGNEVATSESGDLPIARSAFEKIRINNKEYSVMKMERVTPVSADYKTMPSWVYMVDCGQVGLTVTGELVAYDL